MDWSPQIESALAELLNITDSRKIAVFDADGTLWHDDLGEAFFKYQIQNKLAPGIVGVDDPWKYYRSLDEKDTALSSAWLAQICAGLEEKVIYQLAEKFYHGHFKNKPTALFKKLISRFHKSNFEVWICTASPRWSIQPCLAELDIPKDRLIGTTVEIDAQGVLTKKVIEPVPYATGKRKWLERKLGGAPQFVAGNSRGDFDMMCMATHLALAIIYLPHLPPVFKSELFLMAEAKKKNWPIQIFEPISASN